MTSISDLPTVAVKHITQLARGRIVAGVNGFATVSRQWRDAGSSSEGSEQLQLFLDLADMSEAAISMALGWLSQHGEHANVLVIASGLPPAVPADMLYSSVAAASNLRRLELQQQHSLVRLAPFLGQLPQLQHLEAHVAMVCHPDEEDYMMYDAGDGQGIFVDEFGNHWLDPPDLQQQQEQLCPQLTHLRLLLEPSVNALWVDEQLPLLLPARLQQLELIGINTCAYSGLQSNLLSHLTALQQLTVQRVDLDLEYSRGGWDVLEQHLAGVQQLRVYTPKYTLDANEPLQRLAPKITDYSSRMLVLDEGIDGLVACTRLELEGMGSIAAAAPALVGLQLRELALGDSCDATLVAVAQLAAGMPTLRSLQLQGDVGDSMRQEQLSAALEQCRQLTSLGLAVALPSADTTPCTQPFLPVPQQLTGLRCLRVPAELLEQQQGAWLAPLTALNRLCLDLPSHMGHWEFRLLRKAEQPGEPMQALVTEVLQQVQEWPASLQQVEVWVTAGSTGAKRMAWEYVSEAPVGGRFSVWLEQLEGKGAGWGRPLRPCPHLPGVWELQEPLLGRR